MPNFFTANEPEKRLCDKGMDRPAAVLIVLPQVDAEIPVLPGRRLKYVAPRLSSSARSRPNLSVQAPHPPLVTDLIQSFEPDYRAPFLAHPTRSSTSNTAAAGAAAVSAPSIPARPDQRRVGKTSVHPCYS